MFSSFDDYDRDTRGGSGFLGTLMTIAPLRIGAGAVLFIQYALESTLRAWHFIWLHTAWDMIAMLGKAGVPMPQLLAPAAAFIAIAAAFAWFVGFFTRLFSVLFTPVVIGALVIAHRAGDEGHETAAWLFLFVCFTLMLNGSGALSLDRLFKAMSKPKSASGRLR